MSAGDGIVYGVGTLTLAGLACVAVLFGLSLGVCAAEVFARGGGWREVWRRMQRLDR